ncbi:hypothetical protein ABZ721_23570 [Streptomyces sp. NPDC006733]
MCDFLVKGGPQALEGVRSAETDDGRVLPVVLWTYSTRIAE